MNKLLKLLISSYGLNFFPRIYVVIVTLYVVFGTLGEELGREAGTLLNGIFTLV